MTHTLDLASIRRVLDLADYGPMRMVGEDGDYTIVDRIGAEVATVRDRHVAELLALLATQAPAIVAGVERLRADYASAARLLSDAEYRIDALRAIIGGRTVAPTDAEIAAHEAAGGRWRGLRFSGRTVTSVDVFDASGIRAVRDFNVPNGLDMTWWALDGVGRPCAWPVPA